MNFPDIQESTLDEYKYYREERSEKLDIIEDNLYVAMFCSQSMREVFKCGVKVHGVRDKLEGRYIVDMETPRREDILPIIFPGDNLLNGYIETGGRLKLKREFVAEGFLRQPGQDADLCLDFYSDAKRNRTSDSEVLLMT